jgi:predicted ATPase
LAEFAKKTNFLKTMKFTFNNVGLIDKTELVLADLTIICGENNTGKTYATYSIYGFYKNWKSHLREELQVIAKKALEKSNGVQIDLNEIFLGKINKLLKNTSEKYSKNLNQIFSSGREFFEDSIFVAELEKEPNKLNFKKPYLEEISDAKGQPIATISKKEDSHILEILITSNEQQDLDLTSRIAYATAQIIFKSYFPDIFIASTERTGAAIFWKDLNFSEARALEVIAQQKDKNKKTKNDIPFGMKILRGIFESRYPEPVEDNVEFIRRIEDLEKQSSQISKDFPEIILAFEDIVGGKYKLVKNLGIRFFPKKSSIKKGFSMVESSSAIRALLDINFYLKCAAEKGDILVIDEPELNLHPTNQRAFARLIARLVNCGIKVFVTTHSDYIIQELNTLIMLSTRTSHTRGIQTTYGYQDEELLDCNKVKLFTTTLNKKSKTYKLEESLIDKDRGMEAKTFDKNIDELNKIQQSIYYDNQ